MWQLIQLISKTIKGFFVHKKANMSTLALYPLSQSLKCFKSIMSPCWGTKVRDVFYLGVGKKLRALWFRGYPAVWCFGKLEICDCISHVVLIVTCCFCLANLCWKLKNKKHKLLPCWFITFPPWATILKYSGYPNIQNTWKLDS